MLKKRQLRSWNERDEYFANHPSKLKYRNLTKEATELFLPEVQVDALGRAQPNPETQPAEREQQGRADTRHESTAWAHEFVVLGPAEQNDETTPVPE